MSCASSSLSSSPRFTIMIGNRKYSSWSLRGWLAVRLAAGKGKGHFEEVFCQLPSDMASASERAALKAHLATHCPTGKVPTLIDRQIGVTVSESLAIALHIADCFPDLHLLPSDPAARALCIGAAVEMHAGFVALRTHLPMHSLARAPKYGATTFERQDVAADVTRLETLWRGLLNKYGTKDGSTFLFGATPTVADVMFAPVAVRFACYDPDLSHLSGMCGRYVSSLLSWEPVVEWIQASKQEGKELDMHQYERIVSDQ